TNIAIAAQLYVPFSALMAWLMLGEIISAQRWSGILLAFAGVCVIGFDPVVFEHPGALFFTTLGALGMAYATILMRRSPGLGVFRLQAWIALIATPGLLLLSWVFEDGQWQRLTTTSWTAWWAPVYSAVGASIIGHGVVYALLNRYPVSVTAPLMLLSPIFAVGFGVFLWGDQLTWKLVLGGTLTLLGVLVINLRLRNRTA
ncbi:MAG: DMT family transporter, partial [Gammaproteobacteria bacterium]|nr:DMT family transporter [Gammaproteobacteria bacterium]